MQLQKLKMILKFIRFQKKAGKNQHNFVYKHNIDQYIAIFSGEFREADTDFYPKNQ